MSAERTLFEFARLDHHVQISERADGTITYADHGFRGVEEEAPETVVVLVPDAERPGRFLVADNEQARRRYNWLRRTPEVLHDRHCMKRVPDRPEARQAAHEYRPLLRAIDDCTTSLAFDPAGVDCFREGLAGHHAHQEAIAAFEGVDGGTIRRSARLTQYVKEINEAIEAAVARNPDQTALARNFAVPDPGGAAHDFVRDSHQIANIATAAGVARGTKGKTERPGLILYELSRAMHGIESSLESIIAPATRPHALAEAMRYQERLAVEAQAGGSETAHELDRLAEINRKANDAEGYLRAVWASGALVKPSIEQTRPLTPEQRFISNLYAIATLRIGGSRGRYAAVAEMEVDELLRHIASGGKRHDPKGRLKEERIVDLRPEKLALTDGKGVSDHGPDGIYDLTADGGTQVGAGLRGVIHIDDGSLLIVSEVKTSTSSKALESSVDKVGGKTVKAARKPDGKTYDPESEALAYLTWSLRETSKLLANKSSAATKAIEEGTLPPEAEALIREQKTIWAAMSETIKVEMEKFKEQAADAQMAWFRDPKRPVASLLFVRACSLFGDQEAVTPPSDWQAPAGPAPWGSTLPSRATTMFDRVLVLDLFGLPVPGLCLERSRGVASPIATLDRLTDQTLSYTSHRFPSLLRQTVAGGFAWGNDPEILKVLRGDK